MTSSSRLAQLILYRFIVLCKYNSTIANNQLKELDEFAT